MIFLRRNEDNFFEVLDGQQRLKSIFQFIENEYTTSGEMTPEIGKKTFEEIKDDSGVFAKFIAFKINVAFVENADDETTSDIFLRLQEGMPLNTAEKLNAMKGELHNVILNLSNHNIIKNTSIKDHRFAHRLLAAQIFSLELNSDFDLMNFTDIKFSNLKDLYEKYTYKEPPQNVISIIKSNFNFLNKSLEIKAKIISRRGDFIPIYLLSSHLKKNYVTIGIKEDFVSFIIEFLSKVESMKVQDKLIKSEDIPYRDFKSLRSTGALSSRSFRERFKIILGKFLEKYPDIQLKDKNKSFDIGQKMAIYYSDKGICQICEKEVPFDEAEIDHVIPWSKGGTTTVDNAQLVCKTCNRIKGNRT